MIKTAGNSFDHNEGSIYFLAGNPAENRNERIKYPYWLHAVNELESKTVRDALNYHIDSGVKVLIDSGVFALTNVHARSHSVSMDTALGLAPVEIDGFDDLFKLYCNVVTEYGARSWGYIEIDQGGRENKIKTREKLEGMGFKPIPVYHPLNDGWDYFDYLAERYDRICFGNIVQADQTTRRSLLATAWERKQKYPDLWIHVLGLTPNQWLNAYPVNSCDSSAWLSGVRWNGSSARAALKTLSRLPKDYQYVLGDTEVHGGNKKCCQMGAYQAELDMTNWRNCIGAIQ